jgi:hypothetical protein
MGGGGGRGRTTLGDISGLVDKAKDELRRAENAQKRNIFLSFAYEDVDEVNLLRGQAKNENSNIEFNDWSVREPYESSRADYIKQRIGERISQCSVTVVYISAETAASAWVNWEIEESFRRGKKVLAVHKGDVPPANLPSAVTSNKVRVVPWSRLGESLDALK